MEDGDDRSREHHDWEALREFEQRLLRGERLVVDGKLCDLLRRVGQDVGFSPNDVEERLKSHHGAEALLREERARIRDGSRGLSEALVNAGRSEEAGKLVEARAILESFMQREPVPFYRELARRSLVKVGQPGT